MPKVISVARARESSKPRKCVRCGHEIMVGEPYKHFTKRYSPTRYYCVEHSPKASELVAGKAGQLLTLNVGFSHPVTIVAPAGVKITLEKNLLTVSGPSKEAVGQFAASVRAIKPPDPYKEKGIRYATERVIHKQGKKVIA